MRRAASCFYFLSALVLSGLLSGCGTPPPPPPVGATVPALHQVNGWPLLLAPIDDTEYNRKYKFAGPMVGVRYITIHNTAGYISAWDERNRVNDSRADRKAVSFHFAVDEKWAVQLLPLDQCGWHAGDLHGDGNMHSIAIEICRSNCTGKDEPLYRRSEANAVLLAAWLLDSYRLPDNALKKHQDWSGKNCPHRILDEKRWDEFCKRVFAARQAHRHPVVIEAPAAAPATPAAAAPVTTGNPRK